MHLHGTYNLSKIRNIAKGPCYCANKTFESLENLPTSNSKIDLILLNIKSKAREFERFCESAKQTMSNIESVITSTQTYQMAPGPSDIREKTSFAYLPTKHH